MLTDEETNLVGCCGLYCGVCPRFQSEAPGRCHGCKTFTFITSCKIRNCCVKKKGLTTCAECDDFPCEKNNPEAHQYEYFTTNKVCIPNLYRIKDVGLEVWIDLKLRKKPGEHSPKLLVRKKEKKWWKRRNLNSSRKKRTLSKCQTDTLSGC
jgi:hypothetical protein